MGRKTTTNTSSVHLPKDVMVDLLLRLPAKSLARFKCVSKECLALISNDDGPSSVICLKSDKRLYPLF